MPKLEDLTGKRFGRWTVLYRTKNRKTPNGTVVTMWHCRCDCGNEADIRGTNLKNGHSKSCGCYKSEKVSKEKLNDLSGQRFGKLTVVERKKNKISPNGTSSTMWLCKCDCGNGTVVSSQNLKTGHTKSCGCYSDESRSVVHTKHGLRHTRIYSVWCGIKGRCYNTNNPSYKRYGGRGITMCEEWKNDVKEFANWSYSNGFIENAEYGTCTLDRIDNSKGYSPDNCRWVNATEQANNRRTNRIVEYNKEKHTVSEWARILGISNSKLIWHLNKGRTIKDIIDNYLD